VKAGEIRVGGLRHPRVHRQPQVAGPCVDGGR
jgi:hypothetical protein